MIRALIALLRKREPNALDRLAELVEQTRNSPEIVDFRKRRAAAKLGWAKREPTARG